MEVFNNVHVGGQLSMKSVSMPAGSVVDEDFADAADCQASKFQTQNQIRYSQPVSSDVADDECVAHICRLPTEIIAIEVTPIVPPAAIVTPDVVVTTLAGLAAVAHWNFDEAANVTRVDDVGSNDFADVGSNCGNAAGIYNNAAVLDLNETLRAVHHVDLQSAAASGYELSVAVWVKIANSAAQWTIGKNRWAGGFNWAFTGGYDGAGSVRFQARRRDGTAIGATVLSAATLSTGAWHLLIGIIDADNQRVQISVDGAAFENSAAAGVNIGLVDTGGTLDIWNQAGGTGAISVDEMLISQSAWTTDLVADLWNGGAGLNFGAGAFDERQQIEMTGDAVGGTFTLSFDNGGVQTTAAIDFDADTTEIKTKLEALSNIATNDLTVTGGPLPAPIIVRFGGTFAATNVNQMTDNSGNLVAPDAGYTVDVGVIKAADTVFASILSAVVDVDDNDAARTPIVATISDANLDPQDLLVVKVDAHGAADPGQGVNVVIHARSYP